MSWATCIWHLVYISHASSAKCIGLHSLGLTWLASSVLRLYGILATLHSFMSWASLWLGLHLLGLTLHLGYSSYLQVLVYIASCSHLHVLGYMASCLHFTSSDLGLITSWASFTWAKFASWLHFPSSGIGYSTSWAMLRLTWHLCYTPHLHVLGYIASRATLGLKWHLHYTSNLQVLGYITSWATHFAMSQPKVQVILYLWDPLTPAILQQNYIV